MCIRDRVINAEDIKYRFKAYMKQNGAVLAKGWLMGLQFATMLENGDYFEKTKRADELAMQIKEAFEQKKVPFWVESFTNQQFVILSDEQKKTQMCIRDSNHIREMPLDIIKIDKCFIEHLGEDDFSDAFVKMVTELANTIGVHVCVEGVETDRQYAIIKKMGIYYIQGYFFDKPMCIESFEEKYI